MQWGMQQIDGLTNTPRWVAQAVVYQIFPDRFRCGGRVLAHQHLALRCWGSDPSEQGFQGGDLYGVIEALDHLQALGISTNQICSFRFSFCTNISSGNFKILIKLIKASKHD